MIQGSLWDKILLYALPLAAAGILQQLFNAADIAVVGQFVGAEAMAAVGCNSPVIGLLVNLFVGISLGTNVVIANAIGRDDKDTIHRAVHSSILMAVLGGVLIMILGELAASPILRLLGVPAEVFDMALLYLRIYFLGMPVILLYNFESAIFRSEGNTRMPLITLTISGVINVILNLYLVGVMGMNVDGVAIATVVSNLVSAVILFINLMRTDSDIHLDVRSLSLDKKVIGRIVRIGIPSGLQGMAFSMANLVIQSAINSLGAVIMAGSSAAFNLETFAYYVLNSFGQACTTFVGQNHGAGKPDRCKMTLKLCLVENVCFTFSACVLILFFGKNLLSLFNHDTQVIEAGYIRLIYIFGAYVFSLMVEVFSGYLRGYGISLFPAVISLAGICGVRITWIHTVFRAHPGFDTIMTAYPISMFVTAVAMCICALRIRPGIRTEV